MKLLLHICCAPCAIYPVRVLQADNINIMGFFYRYNIHPYTECIKREETLKKWSEQIGLDVIYQTGYELDKFLQDIVFRESKRCEICYFKRLNATALVAKRGKFDYFSTTLLYSKFQNHHKIKELGNAIGKKTGVKFYYQDFSKGWKEGIEESKKANMYRQQYCGCIYSERDRYL